MTSTGKKPEKIVQATVVGASPDADPVPATIISDSRDRFGSRLAKLGVALIIIFFISSGYIQSAQNGSKLEEAENERQIVLNTLDAQTELIKKLQLALQEQNKILKDAGLTPIGVPTQPGMPAPTPQTSTSNPPRATSTMVPRPRPGSSSNPRPRPSSSPTRPPNPPPSPSPTPTPSSSNPVTQVVCELTGICLQGELYDEFILKQSCL